MQNIANQQSSTQTNFREIDEENEALARQFEDGPYKPWIMEGRDWVGKNAQDAYLAGGVYTFVILCLICIFVVMIYGCQRMIRKRRAELKYLKKNKEANKDFPNDHTMDAKPYEVDRTDSPVIQKGLKYMPQVDDVSSENLGHEVTSSQTFFFGSK